MIDTVELEEEETITRKIMERPMEAIRKFTERKENRKELKNTRKNSTRNSTQQNQNLRKNKKRLMRASLMKRETLEVAEMTNSKERAAKISKRETEKKKSKQKLNQQDRL